MKNEPMSEIGVLKAGSACLSAGLAGGVRARAGWCLAGPFLIGAALLLSVPASAQIYAEPLLCGARAPGPRGPLVAVPESQQSTHVPVTVDLMVVYTPRAVSAKQHEWLGSSMTEVNRIYRDTGITFRVVSVRSLRPGSPLARQAAIVEDSTPAIWGDAVSTLLHSVSDDRDLWEARRASGADIVVTMTTARHFDRAGIAWIGSSLAYLGPWYGNAIVSERHDPDRAARVMAHELGHNLGLDHQDNSPQTARHLDFGRAYEGSHASLPVPYFTIMGTSTGRAGHFLQVFELSSDSSVMFQGRSVRIGDSNHRARDAARVTAPLIADNFPPSGRALPVLGALPTVLPDSSLPSPPSPPSDDDDADDDADDAADDADDDADSDGTPPDPGVPPVVVVPQPADLKIEADSELRSRTAVRYSVSVRNAGPGVARSVVVASAFSGGATAIDATTSGCREDPEGLPECGLGDLEAGESALFTIDVGTGGAAETWLRYRGAVGSSASDPTPEDAEVVVSLAVGPPDAPTDLAAVPVGSSGIELRWQDNSRIETAFVVYLQGPDDAAPRRIGSVPANTTAMTADDLRPDTAYRFTVEARNGVLRSGRSPEATATTWYSDDSRCNEAEVLCLGRFEVETAWAAPDGRTGRGVAHRLTAESGDFWFFDPASIEIVVKVLDGCRINGHHWVFGAGLTDLEVTMTVRDLDTGGELTWTNSQGVPFEPIADRNAVVCDGASGTAAGSRRPDPPGEALPEAVADGQPPAAAEKNACMPSAAALCLQDGRYEIRANWQAGEQGGEATAIPRTADTGMFWFFDQDNVELVVKVLDGCALNGRRWVVLAGLTDVFVDVSVTDSRGTGGTKLYRNPGGTRFPAMFDVTAFPCSDGP